MAYIMSQNAILMIFGDLEGCLNITDLKRRSLSTMCAERHRSLVCLCYQVSGPVLLFCVLMCILLSVSFNRIDVCVCVS